MTDRCWISFGPDLEPLASDARRLATAPGPRPDGLLVEGDAETVARALADACASPAGWCRLTGISDDGRPRVFHVHARLVRFVGPAANAAPAAAA